MLSHHQRMTLQAHVRGTSSVVCLATCTHTHKHTHHTCSRKRQTHMQVYPPPRMSMHAQIRTFRQYQACPFLPLQPCKKHTSHKVTQYKTGKASMYAQVRFGEEGRRKEAGSSPAIFSTRGRQQIMEAAAAAECSSSAMEQLGVGERRRISILPPGLYILESPSSRLLLPSERQRE